MTILRFYTSPAFSEHKTSEIFTKLKKRCVSIEAIKTEKCFHVELKSGINKLSPEKLLVLKWLLSLSFDSENLKETSSFPNITSCLQVIECGPRFNFSTADSSNAVQICKNVGLEDVIRLETSIRYQIILLDRQTFTNKLTEELSSDLYDRMTQCVYTKDNMPLYSFDEGLPKHVDSWFVVPILEREKKALVDVNKKLGLAFDDWDINFYTDLFKNKLKRNPTSVECFDLAQSNSEHSRHWFFKGKLIVDGKEYEESLIDMIMTTQKTSNNNNVIKFGDNSSAIVGFTHKVILPTEVAKPSKMVQSELKSDIIFTAETHNMPTAVAPFSGATTGTGGRIRDVQAVGRGGHTIAASVGYAVGNLNIPGYELPWEDSTFEYPENFASPLDIIIEASNGASDYGNKFGEPVITGFVQSYGLKNAEGIRDEYVKPIMFSGGIGYMPHSMISKEKPQKGHLVVKLGGPVYRIGVGGGAASSVSVQGGKDGEGGRSAALDFGAVQRGDAEMGNRLNRVVRACLESSPNPILSIHDQGAGGNGNVLKELVEPEGATIYSKEFKLGDPTISIMELWGAEYQENNAILCDKNHKAILEGICERERCPISFVGEVTSNGCVKLIEDCMDLTKTYDDNQNIPFDLNLEMVLGNMPRKVFNLEKCNIVTKALSFNPSLTVDEALNRVLRLVSVGSKRYLTNKVDRCVTGLVAQQQCVGPLHTPLADCGVITLSYSERVGAATSIGTQPIKGMVYPDVGARMSVGEALTNLVFVNITNLEDVKCSGNWMWSGKTGSEGERLSRACRAMCDIMAHLGIAVDGGKDSLSMAARVGNEKVSSPGTLVISAYAPCPDVNVKVEPWFKERNSQILWVQITPDKYRLGGSALAQCYQQQGDLPPDIDNPESLKNAFKITQTLIKAKKILSGHDVSEGGVITCLLEMCFGGIRGVIVNIDIPGRSYLEALFNEELALILEVPLENMEYCIQQYSSKNVRCLKIGEVGEYGMMSPVKIVYNNEVVIDTNVISLLRIWEETSYRLELFQADSDCINEEWNGLKDRSGPKYVVPFESEIIMNQTTTLVRVAVIREEGSNGDREMIASLMKANFETYDVTMQDLLKKQITLDRFQGIVFPGGFSYADTLGSAKGWAASILFNDNLQNQFYNFAFTRTNTFSLGVCNGCQLMAYLGWISPDVSDSFSDKKVSSIILEHNKSERFECRWSCVKIVEGNGNNVWFKDMENSQLGVWVAHGEGKFTFDKPATLSSIKTNHQICMQYVDDNGLPTESYPMNPNGSPLGIAGICSKDGRHLAIMPHPERCVLKWQWPYITSDIGGKGDTSPWQKMFNNAFQWACENAI